MNPTIPAGPTCEVQDTESERVCGRPATHVLAVQLNAPGPPSRHFYCGEHAHEQLAKKQRQFVVPAGRPPLATSIVLEPLA